VSRGAAALLLVAPGAILLAAVLGLPVVVLLVAAVTEAPSPWPRLVRQAVYGTVLWRTAVLSAATAAICLVLAYPLAWRIAWGGPRERAALLVLLLVPFWTNLLVRCFGWIILLAPTGPLAAASRWLGLAEPPELVHNSTGVLIGMVQIMLPYLVLPLAAVFARTDRELVRAARVCGASATQSTIHVVLPLTLPGAAAGLVMVFMLSLGFFVIPALLGGTRDIFWAQLIEFHVNQVLDWPMAAALAIVLLLLTLLLFAAGQRWLGLARLWTDR
jgi:putative spermidine/putrescine transport system permease protein